MNKLLLKLKSYTPIESNLPSMIPYNPSLPIQKTHHIPGPFLHLFNENSKDSHEQRVIHIKPISVPKPKNTIIDSVLSNKLLKVWKEIQSLQEDDTLLKTDLWKITRIQCTSKVATIYWVPFDTVPKEMHSSLESFLQYQSEIIHKLFSKHAKKMPRKMKMIRDVQLELMNELSKME